MVTKTYFRSQLMVRCEGKDDCRKIHVPYVDSHVQRTREPGQARVSDYFRKFGTPVFLLPLGNSTGTFSHFYCHELFTVPLGLG